MGRGLRAALRSNPRLDVRRLPDPGRPMRAQRSGAGGPVCPRSSASGSRPSACANAARRCSASDQALAETELLRGLVSGALYETLLRSFSERDATERRRRRCSILRTRRRLLLRKRWSRRRRRSSHCGEYRGDRVADLAIEVREGSLEPGAGRPRNSFAITFPRRSCGRCSGAATFAVSLVGERNRHADTPALMPIRSAQILAGKGLACASVSFCVSLAFVGLGHGFFGVPGVIPGSGAGSGGRGFAFAG